MFNINVGRSILGPLNGRILTALKILKFLPKSMSAWVLADFIAL
jgi:hypothetical protein